MVLGFHAVRMPPLSMGVPGCWDYALKMHASTHTQRKVHREGAWISVHESMPRMRRCWCLHMRWIASSKQGVRQHLAICVWITMLLLQMLLFRRA
eukprot:1160369-Pelagomonas_calceolata.AAC.8